MLEFILIYLLKEASLHYVYFMLNSLQFQRNNVVGVYAIHGPQYMESQRPLIVIYDEFVTVDFPYT